MTVTGSAHWTFLDNSIEFPILTEELKENCEGKLGCNECFNVLSTFPKNKTPGNDGKGIRSAQPLPSF